MHSKLTQLLKKPREKISREQSKLYLINEENVSTAMETAPHYLEKQATLMNKLVKLKVGEQKLIEQRKQQTYKLEVKDMPENERYTTLDMEGKLFQNIIKMICPRAETTVSLLLNSEMYAKQEEIRSLVKSIIKTKGDLRSTEYFLQWKGFSGYRYK